ncbi:lysozyme inhibitor LprI family protein [Methylobacterium sp. ID0610]|uniref:lysozyme inhibitor LprI family protein n=1 Tax=Methylobacterium carpenticola TaxID=3344827 RepID=UPI00369B5308
MRGAAILVLFLALGPAAAAAEDPYAPADALSAAPIFRKCSGSRLPEYQKGACLDDAAKDLGRQMKEAVDRKLAAIDAVARRPPSPGSLAGPADAEAWRKAFLAAQAAFEEYHRLHCDGLYDFDLHGGSAAGQIASACKVRQLVARINELRG